MTRAEEALHRALDVRSPIQFHETTGAVFDTLAQIHLIRGRYDAASDCLGRAARRTAPTAARRASGTSGRSACSARGWRCAAARSTDAVALRRRDPLQAGAPPFDALQATLIAAEALTPGGSPRRGRARLAAAADTLDPAERAGGLGRVPAPARRASREQPAAPPTRTTTSRRARRCSICSASATSRRSATSPSAVWSPRTGARSRGRTPPRRGAADLPAARRGHATSPTPTPRSRC